MPGIANRIVGLRVKPNLALMVEFDDGVEGEISLADRLFGPMFEALKDPAYFAKAAVDGFGAVAWPNGADLAPDAIHRALVMRQAVL